MTWETLTFCDNNCAFIVTANGQILMSVSERTTVMADFVGAIDQGTTSTRFMVFDHSGNEVGRHQLEHQQIMPRAGWVEHDPVEIWERTRTVVERALADLRLQAADLAAVGVTNQRETTVVWDRHTGRPMCNAIVWQDTRTDRIASALDRDGRGGVIRDKAGLPPATYFSGGKIQWILENVDGVRDAAARGDAIFGTTDSWLLWNLTGGVDGGVHVTDVTAYSAGLAIGFWSDLEALRQNWNEDRRWHPAWNDEQRDRGYAGWKKAVQRTLDWVDFD